MLLSIHQNYMKSRLVSKMTLYQPIATWFLLFLKKYIYFSLYQLIELQYGFRNFSAIAGEKASLYQYQKITLEIYPKVYFNHCSYKNVLLYQKVTQYKLQNCLTVNENSHVATVWLHDA